MLVPPSNGQGRERSWLGGSENREQMNEGVGTDCLAMGTSGAASEFIAYTDILKLGDSNSSAYLGAECIYIPWAPI